MSKKTSKKVGPTPSQRIHDEITRLQGEVEKFGFGEQRLADLQKLYTEATNWMRGRPGRQPSVITARGIQQRLNLLIEQMSASERFDLDSNIDYLSNVCEFPSGLDQHVIAYVEQLSIGVDVWKRGRFGQQPSDETIQQIEQELSALISKLSASEAGWVNREVAAIKEILGQDWISDPVLDRTSQLLHSTQSWLSSKPGQQHPSASLAGIMEALSSLIAHLSAIEERRQAKPATWQHHPVNRAAKSQRIFDELHKVVEPRMAAEV